jgi:hypothetical protein
VKAKFQLESSVGPKTLHLPGSLYSNKEIAAQFQLGEISVLSLRAIIYAAMKIRNTGWFIGKNEG